MAELTDVNIKPRRKRVPFGPIFLSKMAVRNCRDLSPPFLCFVPTSLPSITFVANAPASLLQFGSEGLLRGRWLALAYAKAPPASRAPETTARVLLVPHE
jgi:hypothetical protein